MFTYIYGRHMTTLNKRTHKKLQRIQRLKLKQQTEPLNRDELIFLGKETELLEALERSINGVKYNKGPVPMSKKTKKRLAKKRLQKEKKEKKRIEREKKKLLEEEEKREQEQTEERKRERERQEERKREREEERKRERECERMWRRERRRRRKQRNQHEQKRKEERKREERKRERSYCRHNYEEINEVEKQRIQQRKIQLDALKLHNDIPSDIISFIKLDDDKKYGSIKYKKLLKKYHPDRHPDQVELYTNYTQFLNQCKISKSTGFENSHH